MSSTAAPDVLRWSPRSDGPQDCAVVALELACGVTYEEALAAAIKAFPDVIHEGLRWSEIKAAATLLGFKGRLKRSFNLEEDTGILNVWEPDSKIVTDHAVYLWEGRIIEPRNDRRQLWLSAEHFLLHYKYKTGHLLVLTSI